MAGNAEQLAQLIGPLAGPDIEQHRSTGVGRIGDVCGAVGQFPDEP